MLEGKIWSNLFLDSIKAMKSSVQAYRIRWLVAPETLRQKNYSVAIPKMSKNDQDKLFYRFSDAV